MNNGGVTVTIPEILTITTLHSGYRAGTFTPEQIIDTVLARIERTLERQAWIHRLSRAHILSYVQTLAGQSPDTLPLFGIPFAIKDNIDLAQIPTTAACAEFAYVPSQSATVVQQLISAGAIPIGKTNLDQFATGLVGVRSPYGACQNSFDPEYIAGGSSAGSAVAVAVGCVSFALGTDTAGSGRIPAAFNNLIGVKPTCGLLSTTGVVPACRSLDTVSIFALTAADAAAVLAVAQGFDERDPFSRTAARTISHPTAPHAESAIPTNTPFRFGVPQKNQLEFFGDRDYARLFTQTVTTLETLGGQPVTIDFTPFLTTARLLYEGPWVAERFAAIENFLRAHPDALHPVTRQIIERGAQFTAVDTFRAQYQLRALQRAAATTFEQIDVLVTPTAGTIYRIAAVLAEPLRLNTQLGYYTNYLNLLDLAAVAVPAGFRADGLPFGITLVGTAHSDTYLLALAARLHAQLDLPLGTGTTIRSKDTPTVSTAPTEHIALAVCGAHLSGLPLNHQLIERGATLLQQTQTAPLYRLYALPGGPPERPGMVRVHHEGAAIEIEVWSMPIEHVGSFIAGIPAPLGIGKIVLATGQPVAGFICESFGLEGATDITAFKSYRKYLANKN